MSLSNNINQYSIDHYLTFMNHFLNPSYNKQEVKLIVKHAKITKHDKVLDVSCGYSRISNLLSAYAHEVVFSI